MSPRVAMLLPFSLAAEIAWAVTTITGVEGELRANVEQYVGDLECDASPAAIRRYARDLPEDVRPALEAFGYYDSQISARRAPPEEGCSRVALSIEPGMPVTVREVSVELTGAAEDDSAMQMLAAAFPLPSGSVLHHGRYREFKGRLTALARERGYLDASFTEERVDVYVDETAADIRLALDSGRRYGFGDVTFATTSLRSDLLENFVPFEPGDPYDSAQIAQFQRDLTASEYFAEARVIPQFDAAEHGLVPIRVEAAPAQPRSTSIGVGFSTDDGPRFSYALENVRRNRAGHQYSLDVLLAQVRQNFTFDYRIPVENPQRDWLSIRAGAEREDIDAGVGSVARVGLHRVRVGDALTATRFVDLLVERDEIAGEVVRTALVLPGMSWAKSYRDDLVRPREGYRLSYEVALGVGDVSLVQADFRGKWITAMPWEARLILRGRAGVTLEDDEFMKVPLSLRFFSGGDNSVRGYDYESLGPRAVTGELIGGNRVLEASVEYEHPVTESWSVAAFIDSGDSFLGSAFEPRTGAGIGARWFTPIGPVRLDVAWPLDTVVGEDRAPRLHISLGPDL